MSNNEQHHYYTIEFEIGITLFMTDYFFSVGHLKLSLPVEGC